MPLRTIEAFLRLPLFPSANDANDVRHDVKMFWTICTSKIEKIILVLNRRLFSFVATLTFLARNKTIRTIMKL